VDFTISRQPIARNQYQAQDSIAFARFNSIKSFARISQSAFLFKYWSRNFPINVPITLTFFRSPPRTLKKLHPTYRPSNSQFINAVLHGIKSANRSTRAAKRAAPAGKTRR